MVEETTNPTEEVATEVSEDTLPDSHDVSVDSAIEALLSLEGGQEEEKKEEQAGGETEQAETPQEVEASDSEEPSDNYKVIIDGVEEEVSLDELLNGYQRQSDYTRKTQSVAEERKAIEALKGEIGVERDKYTSTLGVWEKTIEGNIQASEAQLSGLKEEDPVAWAEAKETISKMKDAIKSIHSETDGLKERQQKEITDSYNKFVAEQAVMLDSSKEAHAIMPDYFDPAKSVDFKSGLRSYAMTAGISEQELSTLSDHRLLIILAKAQKYDRIRQSAANQANKKVVKNPKRTVKSSATVESQTVDEKTVDSQWKKLLKTGNQRDAGKLIESLL